MPDHSAPVGVDADLVEIDDHLVRAGALLGASCDQWPDAVIDDARDHLCDDHQPEHDRARQ